MRKRTYAFVVSVVVKVPTIEEWVERYVASTGLAMWKFMRHWLGQGYSQQDSVKKALPLGVGMLRESIGETITLEEAEAVLRQIAGAYIALADMLERQRRQIPRATEPKPDVEKTN